MMKRMSRARWKRKKKFELHKQMECCFILLNKNKNLKKKLMEESSTNLIASLVYFCCHQLIHLGPKATLKRNRFLFNLSSSDQSSSCRLCKLYVSNLCWFFFYLSPKLSDRFQSLCFIQMLYGFLTNEINKKFIVKKLINEQQTHFSIERKKIINQRKIILNGKGNAIN